MIDIHIENHGSVYLFRPLTETGTEWLNANTDAQYMGNAAAVEPRYAFELAQAMVSDGLRVD